MKRLITGCLVICTLFSLTACKFNYMSPEEIEVYMDGIVSRIGDSQITQDSNLIGNRTVGVDTYVGTYTSDCEDCTDRDVVFGGASIEARSVKVSGHIQTVSGEALVRIRMNGDVIFLDCSGDGYFESTLDLSSGGNYIMMIYEDFTGNVDMKCEYTDSASNG